MIKYCVKKPYTVLVGVLMIFVLGYVSFTHLTTDLLPTFELPYVIVITADVGASPEKIESTITVPLEEGLGKVNGVENVTSTSSENYSMVFLEFAEDTNMDSAMVRLSTQLDAIKDQLPDSAGTPMLSEISMDMIASFTISVDMEGKDIYELSDFVEENIIPELERQDGVASVDASGVVTKSVEVRLNQDKIDEINDKVLAKANKKFADAKKELTDAKKEITTQQNKIKDAQKKLEGTQEKTIDSLAQASSGMYSAVVAATELETQLRDLENQKTEVTAQKETMQKTYDQAKTGIDAGLTGVAVYINAQTGSSVTIDKLDDLLADETKLAAAKAYIDQAITIATTNANQTSKDQFEQLKTGLEQAKQLKDGIAKMDEALAGIESGITGIRSGQTQVREGLKSATGKYAELESGKLNAAAGFGSAGGQFAAVTASLESAKKQLEQAQEQYDDAREEALKNANINKMLEVKTLSQILTAENMEMPAGYIADDGDDEILLKVGEELGSLQELIDLVLCKIDDVGDVRLKDVADITIIDDAEDSYAKVNGNDAILLSISKSSTAGTSKVSDSVNKAIKEMEEKYEGLHITTFLDQGEYIDLIVGSVLKNLVSGALLAILVLILFLRDVRPTIIVAFSIPFSVLFAVVLMYFSNITLNVISLSGLALGVGMLVDNSIVVIENIYRLRGLGLSAPRAAMKGASQVAGAIFSSTLTTVSVFLPIVFAGGLARQLFVDMALTIAYSLGASLIVALTVVPAMGSSMLRKSVHKSSKASGLINDLYAKVLRVCLKVKILPILVAVLLLVGTLGRAMKTGLSLFPEMASQAISVTYTVPDETKKEEAYKLADDMTARLEKIDHVKTVGAMTASSSMSMVSSSMASTMANYKSYSFYLIPDETTTEVVNGIVDGIEETTKDLDGEVTISASGMDMSAMMGGSGVSVTVQGQDLEQMLAISDEMQKILGSVEGIEEVSDGQEDANETIKVVVDKNKAMRLGLTVAQVFGELATNLTTDTKSTTLSIEDGEYEIIIVDDTDTVKLGGLMDYTFETTSMDDEGKEVTEEHKLKEFATQKDAGSVASVRRENLVRTMTVTGTVAEGYNATLLAREVEKKLDKYEAPKGYTVEVGGESESVNETMIELLKMIGLACAFIYLIMVAQFQSLLSPFIIIFTIPLAFTGGLLALFIAGAQISMISMVGFLILAGVVVNNGIVYVDYVNQLRYDGMEKKKALIEAGQTRMRPIFMTALTTVLAMCTMLVSKDVGSEMGQGMVLVVIGGLLYATLMTLFIVPVLYDIFYRKKKMTRVEVED